MDSTQRPVVTVAAGVAVLPGLTPAVLPSAIADTETAPEAASRAHRSFGFSRAAPPPGWYSLYAVPDPDEWKLMVNRERRRWGIPIDREVQSDDVGSGTVPVEDLSKTVEALAKEPSDGSDRRR